MRSHNVYWLTGNKQGKVIDNIAYFFKFLWVSCLHAHPAAKWEPLSVHIAGCCASCQDWCSASSSGIIWPDRLIEQCSITTWSFIPTLSHTVVIYYPLLHNLVHFGICSDELHWRLVRSFIFPGRLKFSIMKTDQHCCPHLPPVVKLAGCKLSNVCLK